MHHWTVPIIGVFLIFSYAIPEPDEKTQLKLQQIGQDLKTVHEELKKSKFWIYRNEIKLYTASAGNADTCGKSILDCYVQELEVVLQEVNLIEGFRNTLKKPIYDIITNAKDTSLQNCSCKKCEEYEEKPLEQFMKDFQTLTQRMQTSEKN